jgi:tetratricopeptide (TPR) repeat protein
MFVFWSSSKAPDDLLMNNDRITQLNNLLTKEPDDAFLQHALALEYFSLQNYVEAKQIFFKLLQKNPDYLPSYYQLGQTLEKLGERENAAEIYRKGMDVAALQRKLKTRSELEQALWLLED